MFKLSLTVLYALAVVGCSSVSVRQLTPDLGSTKNPEGLVYYLPAPYLLVAELPVTATKTSSSTGDDAAAGVDSVSELHKPRTALAHSAPGGAKHKPASPEAPQATAPDPSSKKSDSDSSDGSSTPAPSTDTGFSANTTQYYMRIVYLPDHTRPMALNIGQALLGTSSMKPVLQDGWMLVSLDASADNSALLTALTSVLSASGGGAKTAAKDSKPGGDVQARASAPSDLSTLYTPGHFILRPGLYKFAYATDGTLTGLAPVSYFTGCGAIDATDLENLTALEGAASTAGSGCPLRSLLRAKQP